MKLNLNLLLVAGIAGAVAYLAYRSGQVGESITTGIRRFVEGLSFDPASLGEDAQLTPGARLGIEEMVRAGYMEVLPNGRTRITEAGERYIAEQSHRYQDKHFAYNMMEGINE